MRSTIALAVTAALLLALAVTTTANAAGAGNIFVGGTLGYSDGDDTFTDGSARFTLDDSNVAFGALLGVEITDWMMLQAGYQDLGDFDATTIVNATGNQFASEAKVDGFYTGLMLHRGFGNGDLFFYGTLGIMAWDLEFTGGGVFGEDDGSEPYYGFGIGGKIDSHFKWTGGFTRYEVDQVDIDTIGVQVLWYPRFINE